MKKILSLFFIVSLLFSNIYANEIYSYKEIIPISDGITLHKVKEFHSGHNLTYSYIEADLANENVGLTLLKSKRGMDYSETNAALSLSEENVVASLNADFFSHTSDKTISLGIEIKDGKMLQSPINPSTMATIAMVDDEILMSYLDFHIMAVAPNWEYEEVRHLNKHTSYYGDILMFTKDFNGGYSPAPGGEVLEVVVEDGIITEFRRNLPPCLIPENGCVLAVSEGSSMFFSNNFEIGDEIKFDYYLTPDIKEASLAFGGGAMLVSEGKALTTFSHNITGYNPRSAIGISEDGKKLFLVAVNGRQGESRGMTMTELAKLMANLGCYSAVNLDGGGSTNMIASTVWNEKLHTVNSPSETRRIINSIGLTYKESEDEKEPFGIILENEKNAVFIGETVKISSAVYDEESRPYDGEIKWSSSIGYVKNGVFTADEGGKAEIIAKCGSAQSSTEIFVVDEIAGIDAPDKLKLSVGESKGLSFNAFDTEGHFVSVNNLEPFNITSSNPDVISVENGKITAHNNGTAVISIEKDGASSYISVISGEDSVPYLYDFEEEGGKFASYPSYVGGDFSISDEAFFSGEHSGALSYDFTAETEDSKAVYFILDEPLTLHKDFPEISLSVYSENDFNHEIRALLTDADGKDVRIVFGKDIAAGTWQSLSAKIPEGTKFPVTLKRIYALYQKDEVPDSGTIYIDDLIVQKSIPLSYPEKSENIFNDPLNHEGTGENLVAVALSDNEQTLISRFLDIELEKKANNSHSSLITKEGKSFSKSDNGNALIITIDTEKGGIRATSSTQWNSIKKAVEESSSPYLFISCASPIFGADEFENKVIKDYLSSLDKEVSVIEKGNAFTLKIIDGVRYFTITPPKSSSTLTETVDSASYLEFHLSDSLSYMKKPLYP